MLSVVLHLAPSYVHKMWFKTTWGCNLNEHNKSRIHKTFYLTTKSSLNSSKSS